MLLSLAVATVSTWYAAIKIEIAESEGRKKFWFWGALLLNLGILVLLKYLNFLVYTGRALGQMAHVEVPLKEISIVAPLGLSFYTLQVLGYLIDVSRGTCGAQKNLVKYAAFSCFFPQLVTGPINRYGAMSESLYAEKKFDYNRVTFGLQRIAWGFFKKLVISERMAVLVNTIYGDWHTYSGLYIVFGTVCFAFQLYTDFSGAMDVAMGVSEALGVRLEENFETPFFSRSLSEFWRRWHISLGGWMKDYVFYPLLKSDLFIRIGDMAKGKRFPHGSAW